jgi:hypothetical protein
MALLINTLAELAESLCRHQIFFQNQTVADGQPTSRNSKLPALDTKQHFFATTVSRSRRRTKRYIAPVKASLRGVWVRIVRLVVNSHVHCDTAGLVGVLGDWSSG